MAKIEKVILAYSGGLDTSVILKWLQDYISTCGRFTTLPIINQEETKALRILVPPLEEQEQIAEII